MINFDLVIVTAKKTRFLCSVQARSKGIEIHVTKSWYSIVTCILSKSAVTPDRGKLTSELEHVTWVFIFPAAAAASAATAAASI